MPQQKPENASQSLWHKRFGVSNNWICSSDPLCWMEGWGWDVQVLYYKKIDGSAMKFYIEKKIIVDPGLETDRTNQGKHDNQTKINDQYFAINDQYLALNIAIVSQSQSPRRYNITDMIWTLYNQ